jgi:hypothetical protein
MESVEWHLSKQGIWRSWRANHPPDTGRLSPVSPLGITIFGTCVALWPHGMTWNKWWSLSWYLKIFWPDLHFQGSSKFRLLCLFPLVLLLPKHLLAFQSFDFERTWRLFQKHVVRKNFDNYVFKQFHQGKVGSWILVVRGYILCMPYGAFTWYRALIPCITPRHNNLRNLCCPMTPWDDVE